MIAVGMWKRKLQQLKWKLKVKQLTVVPPTQAEEPDNLPAILHEHTHEVADSAAEFFN